MFTRFTKIGLVALVAIFAVANFAEAKGFGSFSGSSHSSGKSFAQSFVKSQMSGQQTGSTKKANDNPSKISSNNSKSGGMFKQGSSMPQKSSMGGSMCKGEKGCHESCHEKFHCHHYSCHDYPCYYTNFEYSTGIDLQVLDVKMVDSGSQEDNQGPMFRIWFRNNTEASIDRPFSVTAMVGGEEGFDGTPKSSVRLRGIGGGQVMSVDVRLPIDANRPGLPMLNVMIDSHREIGEMNEANNTIAMARAEVKPVEAPKQVAPPAPVVEPTTEEPAADPSISLEPLAEEEEG